MKIWKLSLNSLAVMAAFLAASPLTLAASASPNTIEVAGVRLDMTLDEVKAAVAKYNPAFQIEIRKEKVGFGNTTDTFLSAIKPDPTFQHGYSEEVTVAFTRGPVFRAYAIMHDIGFAKGQERVFGEAIAEINAKYGSGVKSMGGFNDWVYDATGKVIDGGADPKTGETPDNFVDCWHNLFEGSISLHKATFGKIAPNGLPKVFRKGCGVNVRVIVQTYDLSKPTEVQEIFTRVVSDKLAVQDGRPTEDVEAVRLSQRKLNPAGKPIAQ